MGVVIVGFAVMAAFAMSDTTLRQAAVDNLVDRNLSIATNAVFWKQKRDPFSGGNASYAGLAEDGMQTLFLGEETLLGLFKITAATETELEITAVSSRYPEVGIRTFVREYEIDSTVVRYDGSITIDG